MQFIALTLLSQTNKQCVRLLCCSIPQYRPSQHTAVQFNATEFTKSHTQCNTAGKRQSAFTNWDWLTSASRRNTQHADCGTAAQDVLGLSNKMLFIEIITFISQARCIQSTHTTHSQCTSACYGHSDKFTLYTGSSLLQFFILLSSTQACYIPNPTYPSQYLLNCTVSTQYTDSTVLQLIKFCER
jgi:hypothetical protein